MKDIQNKHAVKEGTNCAEQCIPITEMKVWPKDAKCPLFPSLKAPDTKSSAKKKEEERKRRRECE